MSVCLFVCEINPLAGSLGKHTPSTKPFSGEQPQGHTEGSKQPRSVLHAQIRYVKLQYSIIAYCDGAQAGLFGCATLPLSVTSLPTYLLFVIIKWQPHPKYKANSARISHIAVWERDLNCSLEDDWGRVARWR